MSLTVTKPPALTTIFTPSPSCLTDLYLYTTDTLYYLSLGPPNISDCFPSGWEGESTAYFSPGVCPSGYRVACSDVVSIGSLTETIATCCPSGYKCQTEKPARWYSMNGCTSIVTSPATYIITSAASNGFFTTRTGLVSSDGVNARSIQVRWQNTDIATQTSIPVVSTSGLVASSTSLALPTHSPTSGGLPTAAKAGIAVGAIVAVFAALLGIFLCLRKLEQRRAHMGMDPNAVLEADTKPLDHQELYLIPEIGAGRPPPIELHGRPVG